MPEGRRLTGSDVPVGHRVRRANRPRRRRDAMVRLGDVNWPAQTVTLADAVARLAHHGQADFTGRSYYAYLRAVAARTGCTAGVCVALLKDVLRVTHVSRRDLEVLLRDQPLLVEMTELMTPRETDSRRVYLARCASRSRMSRLVLRCDLLQLIHDAESRDEQLMAVYQEELNMVDRTREPQNWY